MKGYSSSHDHGYFGRDVDQGCNKVDELKTSQLSAPSVNIEAKYPALPDHDSMNLHLLCVDYEVIGEYSPDFFPHN